MSRMIGLYADHGFDDLYYSLARELIYKGKRVDVGEWHAQPVSNPLLVTREVAPVAFDYPIPPKPRELRDDVKPNMPFAEAQFSDRVSGIPHNPPPSASLWPYKQADHSSHLRDGKFSHTYPERFWCKEAGGRGFAENFGIRYDWGDLNDVVEQLAAKPMTRQAYLPVWFPEDTGNVSNVRVPCTLGYHFLCRDGKLDVSYFIRSVDFTRHFRDDVYMAGRLCQWVLEQLQDHEAGSQGESYTAQHGGDFWLPGDLSGDGVKPGTLHMHIVSLHCMEGDVPKLRKELNAPSRS